MEINTFKEILDSIRINTNLESELNISMFLGETCIFKGFKQDIVTSNGVGRKDISIFFDRDTEDGIVISSTNKFSFQFYHPITVIDFLKICSEYDINPFFNAESR